MTANSSQLGINAFIEAIKQQAAQTSPGWKNTAQFILRISDAYAGIRFKDIRHPRRFLMQLTGNPPVRFGKQGFNPELIDDSEPMRHYIAFVFVGFWLPYPLAGAFLWIWEILGIFRHGIWGEADMKLGWSGIEHGGHVRRHGPIVLSHLIKRDLGE